MTNQEILQQVYDSMPNQFDLGQFYHAVRLIGNVDFQEAATFYNEQTAINSSIQNGTILIAKDTVRMKDTHEASFRIGRGYQVVEKETKRFAVMSDIAMRSFTPFYHWFSYTDLDTYFTIHKEEPIEEPVVSFLYEETPITAAEIERLQDIERKYNQLMKSFKEVER